MAWTWPGGWSQLMLGRKKEMPWSNASKWPEREVQKEAVRPSTRRWSVALALKNAFKSLASCSARSIVCVAAFVSCRWEGAMEAAEAAVVVAVSGAASMV